MRALAPEGIFLSRIREFRGWKKRISAAKAGHNSAVCGTAEAVPFLQDVVLTQSLLAPAYRLQSRFFRSLFSR